MGEDTREFDHESVDKFAAALKRKLDRKRREGFGGWYDRDVLSDVELVRRLFRHVGKGDPIDIAAFAMFIHQRNIRRGLVRDKMALTIDDALSGATDSLDYVFGVKRRARS